MKKFSFQSKLLPPQNFGYHFLTRWTANILGLFLASYLLPGISFPQNQWWVLVLAALVFGIINLLLKPILILLTCQMILLTLGLFIIIVNGALLYLTTLVVPQFEIVDFGSAILGALIVSIVNLFVYWFLGEFSFEF